MQYICDVSRTNEHGEGCEHAVVTITPDLAKKILARRALLLEMKAKDRDSYEAYFWDCSATFYDSSAADFSGEDTSTLLDSDALDTLSIHCDGEWVETAADLTGFTAARTECDQMVIREDDVCWYAIPKHSDWTVLTQGLPYSVIASVLAAQ